MLSYWRMHHLNNKVHCTLMLIWCVCFKSQNSLFTLFYSLPKCYMTFSNETVLWLDAKAQTQTNYCHWYQMTNLYLINKAWQKIKVQLKASKQQKFQGMFSHFISGLQGSLITSTGNMWWRCTHLFLNLCHTEVVKCWDNLILKPQLHEWHLGCSFSLKLVLVSCTLDCGQLLLHLKDCVAPITVSHNFHCGWRKDSGRRIKCTCSLVSAQTWLGYKQKEI